MKDKHDKVTIDAFDELYKTERIKKSMKWLYALETSQQESETDEAIDNVVRSTSGDPIMVLNMRLIKKQGLSQEAVDKIKQLHLQRMSIEHQMEIARVEDLKIIYEYWVENQYLLQDQWKFPRDANHHRFWEVPRCTCPIFDNKDSYPYQQYINCDCPVHGS